MHMGHDAIGDTFAKLKDDVLFDVEVEPHLQALRGKSSDHQNTTIENDPR